PRYIGLRLKRYGPQVTSRDEYCPGTVVVRARRNVSHPHPASAAPATNSPPPTTLTARGASVARPVGSADSTPTPHRYASRKTHGTGTRRITSPTGPGRLLSSLSAMNRLSSAAAERPRSPAAAAGETLNFDKP